MKINARVGLAIVVMVIIGSGAFLLTNPDMFKFTIHGYDGPVAEIVEVDHTYPANFNLLSVDNIGTAAWVDTGTNDALDLFASSGVRAEINSAPRVIEDTLLETIVQVDVDDDAETNSTKTWEVHEAVCEMGVTLSTYKGGLQGLYETTFWVQVEESEFSIFSDANQSLAFIIFVETSVEADIIGSFESSPQAGGSPVNLTTVEEFDTPQWIIDSGYTENLDGFKVVKFPVVALSGAPTSILGFSRQESSATLKFQISVIVFGLWEKVVPYTAWTWPEPPDPLATIYVVIFAIAGIVGTAILVVKLKKYSIPVIILMWVIIVYLLWYLEVV